MQTNNIPATKRSHRNRAQWQALVNRFEKSDMTIKDFCQQENISRGTFSRWRIKLLQDSRKILPGFIEIPTTTPAVENSSVNSTTPWSVELGLPGGGRLHIRFGL